MLCLKSLGGLLGGQDDYFFVTNFSDSFPHYTMLTQASVTLSQSAQGAEVVCRELVVPHWDRSGIHPSICLSIKIPESSIRDCN